MKKYEYYLTARFLSVRNDRFIGITVNMEGHLSSSNPSLQSRAPSHLRFELMHSPELHLNSFNL